MIKLNIALVKTKPTKFQMKRLVELANTDIKELSELTGRSESAITKYISCKSYDYLFLFALNCLVQERLEKILIIN